MRDIMNSVQTYNLNNYYLCNLFVVMYCDNNLIRLVINTFPTVTCFCVTRNKIVYVILACVYGISQKQIALKYKNPALLESGVTNRIQLNISSKEEIDDDINGYGGVFEFVGEEES
uniref:Uncharacterized protein n=1 Tax=Timema cristinae TaxID=61476 RepID=A0A7R9CP22_TIMCR|nr:unnamed protein product [Timema cristinae]